MKVLKFILAIILSASCSSMRSGKFVKLHNVAELPSIAKNYNVSISDIRDHNEQIKDNSWVFIPHKAQGVVRQSPRPAKKVVQTKKREKRKPASYHLDFEWPLEDNFQITSGFGMRRGRPHQGIDIGAKHGTKIRASADGKVVFSGWMRGYGLIVVIKHDKEFKTAYAHASRVIVKKGSIVRKGDVIAKVGNTGRSTGSHLHFEIRLYNEAIDPSDFFQSMKLVSKGVWPYMYQV